MGKSAAADVWEVVHAERRHLADDLADLTDEQWQTPSLCAGWDVHDVLAHLVDTAKTGRLSFVRDMIRARMDFDRANETGVAREARTYPRDTLAAFREAGSLTRTPPANLATRLVEAIVHGEDIRRPLAIEAAYPAAAVTQALAHQLRTSTSMGGGRERAAGFRFIDTETGARWGHGEDVQATALDFLLAVSGRGAPEGRFSGGGESRFGSAT